MAENKSTTPGGWSWSWSAKKPEVMKGSVEVVAGSHDPKACPTCGSRMGTINKAQGTLLKESERMEK